MENNTAKQIAELADVSPSVQKQDKNSFRYDYFNIWSSGLKYRDEIIDIIRSEKKFEIVEMLDYRPSNLGEFVAELYIYDSIPKPPEVLVERIKTARVEITHKTQLSQLLILSNTHTA